MRTTLLGLTACLAALALTAGSASASSQPTIVGKVVEISGPVSSGFDANSGDFDILRQAVVDTGLVPLLDGKRQLTVFAPNDQQFQNVVQAITGSPMPPSESAAYSAIVATFGVDTVRTILAYHVAPGERTAADVVPATRIRTLAGQFIRKMSGSANLMGAGNLAPTPITGVDIQVSNGVIHTIGGVLLPKLPS
jgi:uncharacterized surface protein with fasciclin (FAS1) repeats